MRFTYISILLLSLFTRSHINAQIINTPSTGIYNLLNQNIPLKFGSQSDFIGFLKYRYGSPTEDLNNVFNSKLAYHMSNSWLWDEKELKNKGVSAFDLLKGFFYNYKYYEKNIADSLISVSNNFFSEKSKKALLTLNKQNGLEIIEDQEGRGIYKDNFNYIKGLNGEIIYSAIKDGIPFGLAAIEDKNKNIIVGLLGTDKSFTINGIGMIKFTNGVYYIGKIENNIPVYQRKYVNDYEKSNYTSAELKALTQFNGFSEGFACLKDGSIVSCELVNGKPIGIGERYNFRKNINYFFNYVQFSEIGAVLAYTPPKTNSNISSSSSNNIAKNMLGNISSTFVFKHSCNNCFGRKSFQKETSVDCNNCNYWTRKQKEYNVCTKCRDRRIIVTKSWRETCKVCKGVGSINAILSTNFKQLLNNCFNQSDNFFNAAGTYVMTNEKLSFKKAINNNSILLNYYDDYDGGDIILNSDGTLLIKMSSSIWSKEYFNGSWSVDGANKFLMKATVKYNDGQPKVVKLSNLKCPEIGNLGAGYLHFFDPK
jgi:hypothetical protein